MHYVVTLSRPMAKAWPPLKDPYEEVLLQSLLGYVDATYATVFWMTSMDSQTQALSIDNPIQTGSQLASSAFPFQPKY